MSRRAIPFLLIFLAGLALALARGPLATTVRAEEPTKPASAPDASRPSTGADAGPAASTSPDPASGPKGARPKAAKEEDDKGSDPKPKEKERPASKKDITQLKGYDPGGGQGRTLYEVPIEGTIDLGLAPFVERVIERASSEDIVLIRVKTFGGRVDAAVRIRDALLDSRAATVAYVDRRAISAGALISLACHTLVMGPGASIGAATPVQQGKSGEMEKTSEKVVSYMRAEMRSTAEARGRRADLAEAMVDADIEIKGVTEKGKLLTLTTERALELGLADATATDFEATVRLLNLGDADRVRLDTHWAEKVARVLTDPVVSSLLMTFGFLRATAGLSDRWAGSSACCSSSWASMLPTWPAGRSSSSSCSASSCSWSRSS